MAGLTCENCGQPVGADDEFCINCGRMLPKRESMSTRYVSAAETVTDPMVVAPPSTPVSPGDTEGILVAGFCPECGGRTRAGWLFCMQCGTRLRPVRPTTPTHTVNLSNVASMAPDPDSSPDLEPAPPLMPAPMPEPDLMPTSTPAPTHEPVTNPVPTFIPERPTTEPVKTVKISSLDDFAPAPELDTGMEWDKTDAGVPEDDFPTSVYDDEDDAPTMVYGDETPHPTCTITRLSTGETLSVPYPATLGRGSAAAVRITGNRFIGRVHASVSERDGQLYVTDEGSANHTLLNGEMLPPHEERPLSDGDVLSLAKEEFTVSIV